MRMVNGSNMKKYTKHKYIALARSSAFAIGIDRNEGETNKMQRTQCGRGRKELTSFSIYIKKSNRVENVVVADDLRINSHEYTLCGSVCVNE